MSNELTRLSNAPLEFTSEQRAMIRDTYASGANDGEFAVLMEIAKTRRLNPLLRQIHFVQRYDSQKQRKVWAVQVAIDGLRAIAERTGLYAGQDEPEFTYRPDGELLCAKVRIYRSDWPRPAVGVAYYDECVQTARDQQTGKDRPNAMWSKMKHTMTAKCAESFGFRKAFPEDTSGLYTDDEPEVAHDEPRLSNVIPRREEPGASVVRQELEGKSMPEALTALASVGPLDATPTAAETTGPTPARPLTADEFAAMLATFMEAKSLDDINAALADAKEDLNTRADQTQKYAARKALASARAAFRAPPGTPKAATVQP